MAGGRVVAFTEIAQVSVTSQSAIFRPEHDFEIGECVGDYALKGCSLFALGLSLSEKHGPARRQIQCARHARRNRRSVDVTRAHVQVAAGRGA